MSAKKQSRRASFYHYARITRYGRSRSFMRALEHLMERCEPRLIGFDLGEPGGDHSAVVSWGRRNGKTTLVRMFAQASSGPAVFTEPAEAEKWPSL